MSIVKVAGQIKVCKDQWAKLTSHCDILQMVNGYKLEFIETPEQTGLPSKLTFNDAETTIIDQEIK